MLVRIMNSAGANCVNIVNNVGSFNVNVVVNSMNSVGNITAPKFPSVDLNV